MRDAFLILPALSLRLHLFASTTQLKEEAEEEEEEEEEVRDVYAVQRTDYGEITDFKASSLGARRLQLAQKVCLDAKFLSHTKRLATRSALLLPLRTPQAPLIGDFGTIFICNIPCVASSNT